MPLIEAQIINSVNGQAQADAAVNTVWHTISDGGFNPSVDYQNHANELRDLFGGLNSGTGGSFHIYKSGHVVVKVYDKADPKHSPPRATAQTGNGTDTLGDLGPPQVSLCLSYFSGINLPSQRGRIYVGPFGAGRGSVSLATYVAGGGAMAQVLDLGHGLFDIGGSNVSHVVWSRKHSVQHVVTDYYVDSRWDTVRSRCPKPAARVVLHP